MAGGLIEANFSTKDHTGALMVDVDTGAQSWEQSKAFSPSQDMLTENKTAETFVVVIGSFFCSLSEGNNSYTIAASVRFFQRLVDLLHNSAELDRAGEVPKILSAPTFYEKH